MNWRACLLRRMQAEKLPNNLLISKETTLGHRFVNNRSVDKLGWPPGLSTGRLLTNSAASPPLTRKSCTPGYIPCFCRLRPEPTAEFDNGPLVEKPFGERSCLVKVRVLGRQAGQDAPQQPHSQIPLSSGVSVGN
jgi:hypothetical protein